MIENEWACVPSCPACEARARRVSVVRTMDRAIQVVCLAVLGGTFILVVAGCLVGTIALVYSEILGTWGNAHPWPCVGFAVLTLALVVQAFRGLARL